MSPTVVLCAWFFALALALTLVRGLGASTMAVTAISLAVWTQSGAADVSGRGYEPHGALLGRPGVVLVDLGGDHGQVERNARCDRREGR